MIRHNPNFEAELRREGTLADTAMEKAEKVANTAGSLGRQVAPSYQTQSQRTATGARVEADTDGINAAGWIEFGTGHPTPTPAYAPLRRAAEAEGLELR